MTNDIALELSLRFIFWVAQKALQSSSFVYDFFRYIGLTLPRCFFCSSANSLLLVAPIQKGGTIKLGTLASLLLKPLKKILDLVWYFQDVSSIQIPIPCCCPNSKRQERGSSKTKENTVTRWTRYWYNTLSCIYFFQSLRLHYLAPFDWKFP